MTAALDPPGTAALFTEWSPQPLAIVAVVALAAAYVYGVRRLEKPWPVGRSAVFALGVALLAWTTNGMPEAYADSLYWVWLSQTLVLWLVVPMLLLFGHPIQLARAVGRSGALDRVLASKPIRIIANPLIGPALVPLLSFALFFGPVAGWAIGAPPVGWLLQLVLVVIGAAMALPLVGLDDESTSTLAVGLALAIGCFELVIDALPGILLRLNDSLATSYFDVRAGHSWSPEPLRDQGVAGAVLWCVAEIIDLPFVILVFRRWLRVDTRDAARVDAVLEAERAVRGAETDEPWWLSDPAMRERLKRQV